MQPIENTTIGVQQPSIGVFTLVQATNFTATNFTVATLGVTLPDGMTKISADVLVHAVAGTDYAAPTVGSSILYGNGAGGFSNVTVGANLTFVGGTLAATVPATVGSSILYGDGAGGFSNATIGSGISFVGGVLSSSGAPILSASANNSAQLDIEPVMDSTYNVYMFVFSGITLSTDGAKLLMRAKISGAYSSTAGDYFFHETAVASNSAAYAATASQTATSVEAINNIGNAANKSGEFIMYLVKPNSTSLSKLFHIDGTTVADSGVVYSTRINGSFTPAGAVSGIRILPNLGTIVSGTVNVYGLIL